MMMWIIALLLAGALLYIVYMLLRELDRAS
jgi:hypothetical protein